jgi:hypothetical protein
MTPRKKKSPMPSNILKFELNQPVTVALSTISTMDVFNDYGKPQVLFALADNRRLYATPELARKIKSLGVRELESFAIRKYKKGRNVFYDVWLSTSSEKARAVEEAPEIAAQLSQLNVIAMPAPAETQFRPLLATGTDGPVLQPSPVPQLARASNRPRAEIIPFNVAFREVTRFVVDELKACGEQWTDQAKQDIVSTVLISAAQKGLVGVWER